MFGSVCKNSFIQAVLGETECEEVITDLDLEKNKFLIESFENPFSKGKIVLIVTGYDKNETIAASEYLIASTDLKTSVGSKYVGEIEEEEGICNLDVDCKDLEEFVGTPYCATDEIKLMQPYTSYSCVSEKCVANTLPKEKENCDNGCENEACVEEENEEEESEYPLCRETDSGEDKFKYGLTTYSFYANSSTLFLSHSNGFDKCDGDELIEFYCEDNSSQYMSKRITCENGCENGACLTAESQCSGCFYGGVCYAITDKIGKSKYCAGKDQVRNLKSNEATCDADYGCKSNICCLRTDDVFSGTQKVCISGWDNFWDNDVKC